MKKIILLLLLFSEVFAVKDTLSFAAVGDIMKSLNYPNKTSIKIKTDLLISEDGKITYHAQSR